MEYILELSIHGHVTIYETITPKVLLIIFYFFRKYWLFLRVMVFTIEQELQYGDTLAHGTSGKVLKAIWKDNHVAVKHFNSYQPQVFRNELTLITYV